MTGSTILSDLDGVLVDSAGVIERTWRRWAERWELDAEVVLAACSGVRSLDLVRRFAPAADAVAETSLVEGWELEASSEVSPLPGARELVRTIAPERFAIVTSCTRMLALARLHAVGIAPPAVLVSADEVTAGKPDPEAYVLAARRLLVPPQDCVVLEDAPSGVAAGLAAGMTVVGVTTTHAAAELRGAHRVVASLLELQF